MGYSVTGVFDMEIFSRFADAVAMLPDWLSLLGSPVLFLLLAAVFFACRREHWVRPCWLACAVAGFLPDLLFAGYIPHSYAQPDRNTAAGGWRTL